MNFELILIQIVIGILIGLVIIKLFQTNKSIAYEKRLGKYGISSIKDSEFSFLDQVHLFLYGLIKTIAKYLNKFKFYRRNSKKYEKYISYDQNNEYNPIDFIAMKHLIMITVIVLNIIMSLIRLKTVDLLSIILGVVSYYILDIILIIIFKYKTNLIEEDLLKAIMVMNNSFRSGNNIIQTVEIVTKELNGPIQDEFKKILRDVKYGLSIDVAFSRFYNRVEIDDAKYITISLSLLNKTGGNIISVFNNIEKSIMNRRELKKELKSLSSAARMTFKILTAIPIIIILLILVLNPLYFLPLVTTPIGVLVSVTIIVLFSLYIYIIRKVLEVKIL